MKDGLYCDGGKNHIFVDWDGSIYSCRDLAKKTHFLGNFVKEDVKLRDEVFAPCPWQKSNHECICSWTERLIVKDGVETKLVRWFGGRHPLKEGTRQLYLWFSPTLRCNYSCIYCCSSENVPHELPASTYIEAFERFFKTNSFYGGVAYIGGGEPLMYSGIGEMLRFFEKSEIKVEVATNLSANIYKKVIQNINPSSVLTIHGTVHPSERKFSWEMFQGKVKMLQAFGYNVVVSFVGYPDQIMLAPFYHEWCKNNGLRFQVIPMIGCHDGIQFNSESDYPEIMRKMFHLDDKIT